MWDKLEDKMIFKNKSKNKETNHFAYKKQKLPLTSFNEMKIY